MGESGPPEGSLSRSSEAEPTDDQRRAMTTLDGPVFVAAGAGSGKTGVVTSRFVHAVATGFARVDEILTITFTKKAAAEMMERIRRQLREKETKTIVSPTPGQTDRMSRAYRDIERARICTIDSFCSALLRANALAAGIDPKFTAADESQSGIIREEVFDISLKEFVESRGERAVELIAAYDPNLKGDLFQMVMDAYDRLRVQGKEITLPRPGPPQVEAARLEFKKAIKEARLACDGLTELTISQRAGLEKLTRLESALDADDPSQVMALAGEEIKVGRLGSVKETFSCLEGPRRAFVNAVLSSAAAGTLDLFRELLESFDRRYSQAKYSQGVLDFTDLSILTRDLLKGNAEVQRKISSAFRLVMVDEFQDTNPLQHQIVKMVAGKNLFLVGDENQAIYGFRDAEVSLFQKERDAADKQGYLIELKENFRSQPEIIGFVDHVFNREGMLAPRYLELKASAEREKGKDHGVEVMLVDCRRDKKEMGLTRVKKDVTRAAEAQLIAERLKELFAEGYERGDVAILVRKGREAEIYRDALTRAGINNYFSVGRSYYGKLELHDIINMLKLIINPLDDVALLCALRSPMGGLSDDALYWLRNAGAGGGNAGDATAELEAAGYRGPLWPVLESPERLERFAEDDRQKLKIFIERLENLRAGARRSPLGKVVAEVIGMGDYLGAVAARPGGKQDVANLLKLLDMAADFETSYRNDLTEFTRFLDHQKEKAVKEVEAPTEAEGVDAVQIMTMHSAKGLEFPVVVLPNLHAAGKSGKDNILLDRGGGNRMGLRIALGDSLKGGAFAYEEMKDEEDARSRQEEKRLGYVAMTRARSRLILSGVAPADDQPKGDKKSEPAFDWLRRILGLKWERDENLGGRKDLEVNGARVRVDVHADPEGAAERYRQAGKARRREEPERVAEDLSAPPVSIFVPANLSPTSLDTFEKCPRRYLLENVLGMQRLFAVDAIRLQGELSAAAPVGRGGRAETSPARKGNLTPMEMGTLMHRLFEINLPAPSARPVTERLLEALAGEIWGPEKKLAPADHELALRLAENLKKAPCAGELFRAEEANRLKKELSFSMLLGDTTIISGMIDALIPAASPRDAVLVIDYKTGETGEEWTADEAALSYRRQMEAYALAAGGMHAGPVRVVLVFLGGDGPVEHAMDFRQEDLPVIRSSLESLVDSMTGGEFPARFETRLCSWCAGGPNGARLCPAPSGSGR